MGLIGVAVYPIIVHPKLHSKQYSEQASLPAIVGETAQSLTAGPLQRTACLSVWFDPVGQHFSRSS